MKSKRILTGIIALIVLLAVSIYFVVGNGILNPVEHNLELGYKYLEDGNYEEAILAFNKVIDIEPRRYEAYLGLADVYIEKGDYDKAIEILQKGISATGGNEELKKKLSEIEKLSQNNDSPDTPQHETSAVSTLSLSNFAYRYESGGHATELNEGAIGGMNLSYTVNGPSNVCEVRIATWQEEPFTQEQIDKYIHYYEEIWKESWHDPMDNRFPYEDGSSHPVDEDLLGKKAYVLLIGLDKNCNAVAYSVVEEIIG